jgi:hypothetical protein
MCGSNVMSIVIAQRNQNEEIIWQCQWRKWRRNNNESDNENNGVMAINEISMAMALINNQ